MMNLARRRDPESFTWRPNDKWMLIVAGAFCAVGGLPAVWMSLSWLFVPAVCSAVVAHAPCFSYQDLRIGR